MKNNKVYRIKREDGKFSKGGFPYVHWGDKGKFWSIGPLKSHLTQLYDSLDFYRKSDIYKDFYKDDPYKNCIIEEYDLSLDKTKSFKVKVFNKGE